jgi:hypothetical protein
VVAEETAHDPGCVAVVYVKCAAPAFRLFGATYGARMVLRSQHVRELIQGDAVVLL